MPKTVLVNGPLVLYSRKTSVVAAGAVVTKSVPDHGIVTGVPARIHGYACGCGRPAQKRAHKYFCPSCNLSFVIKE